MVEGVVEVVERFAFPVVRGEGAVCGEEGLREWGAEEFEHGEVGFRVSEVGCGVEDEGGSGGEGGGVSGPEVAVEEGGGGVVAGEDAVGGVEDFGGGDGVAVLAGEVELGAEALFAVEVGPGGGGGIGLGGGADEVVVVEAVVGGGGGVEAGELCSEVFPGVAGEGVEVEPFEGEPSVPSGVWPSARSAGVRMWGARRASPRASAARSSALGPDADLTKTERPSERWRRRALWMQPPAAGSDERGSAPSAAAMWGSAEFTMGGGWRDPSGISRREENP